MAPTSITAKSAHTRASLKWTLAIAGGLFLGLLAGIVIALSTGLIEFIC